MRFFVDYNVKKFLLDLTRKIFNTMPSPLKYPDGSFADEYIIIKTL